MAANKKLVVKKLGEVLISRGLITETQLEEALSIQKTKKKLLGEILVDLKYITEEAIAWALTVMYGYPYLPLENYAVDKEVVKLIPEEIATRYQVIGVDRIGAVLNIAMASPLSDEAILDLERVTKCKIRMYISTLKDVRAALDREYGNGEAPPEGESRPPKGESGSSE